MAATETPIETADLDALLPECPTITPAELALILPPTAIEPPLMEISRPTLTALTSLPAPLP